MGIVILLYHLYLGKIGGSPTQRGRRTGMHLRPNTKLRIVFFPKLHKARWGMWPLHISYNVIMLAIGSYWELFQFKVTIAMNHHNYQIKHGLIVHFKHTYKSPPLRYTTLQYKTSYTPWTSSQCPRSMIINGDCLQKDAVALVLKPCAIHPFQVNTWARNYDDLSLSLSVGQCIT